MCTLIYSDDFLTCFVWRPSPTDNAVFYLGLNATNYIQSRCRFYDPLNLLINLFGAFFLSGNSSPPSHFKLKE